jgi:TolB-like protein
VTREGHAKVLDFGLARRVPATQDDVDTRTQELQAVAGTLEYMAPETLRGGGDDVQADVWALGVVLYEMATGRRPFGGRSTFEIAGAILHAEPPPLPERVPAALRRLVARCLDKQAADRPSSAADVRDSLDAIESRHAGGSRGHGSTPRRARSAVRHARIKALAVLPLDNLSRDPDEEFFADGMTEALIASLARIGTLRVISRTSVMRYKGARQRLPDIARELGVDAVVEGSVIRSGDRLRITVQLIHATTDSHLWAETYDRELADVLSLQDDVARAVAVEVRAKLTVRERRRLTSARRLDPAAHEAYLKGRYYWSRRSEPDLTKSIEYFTTAVERDSGYALAWAGIADSYGVLGFQGHLAPGQSWPRARAAAERALSIDPQLPEAHAARGYVLHYYDWDFAAADLAFRQAIEHGPNYATAHHWYALHLADLGRTEVATREIRKAQQLDPLSLIIQVAYGGYILMLARQYAEGVGMLREVLAMDPHFIPAQVYLGWMLEGDGRPDAALAQLEEVRRRIGPYRELLPALGRVYARLGRRQDALEAVEDLGGLRDQGYVPSYSIALVYEALGDTAQALAWLERAIDDRDAFVAVSAADPRLDGLRSDPRFGQLMRRIRPG